MKKKVFIMVQNHMDPMWRRCFERDIHYKGQVFVPYADLEAFYIEDNIRLCRKYPFYRFELESVIVLKKFLERHPEYEQEIAELITAGRMYISFTGNNIIDTNLVQGESLVRNLLNGYLYMKQKYGILSEGVDRQDGFGNAAQLPQIIRGFGSKWVRRTSYVPMYGAYWQGVDGSRVYHMDPPCVGGAGSFFKYRPCPACGGHREKHCDVCGDRRIDLAYMELARPEPSLDEARLNELSVPGFMNVGGEELLPNEEIIRWVQENADAYDISFATFRDYLPYYQAELAQTEASEDVHPSAELNPSSTGCYVSRIRTKQLVRQLENRLTAAETLCTAALLQGRAYPAAELVSVWEKAFFSMFHDAVTGTHVDDAYDELMDVLAQANSQLDTLEREHLQLPSLTESGAVTVMNPNGIAVTAAATVRICSGTQVRLLDAAGEEAPVLCQRCADGIAEVTFLVKELPAFAQRSYTVQPRSTPAAAVVTELGYSEKAANVAVLQNLDGAGTEASDGQLRTIENEYYRIDASDRGILCIFDKKLGCAAAQQSEYMVGEWILEHDEGTPWSTLSTDMRRIPLGKDTRLVRCEQTGDVQKLTYRIKPSYMRAAYSLYGIDITYSVSLVRGCDRVLFEADVWWDTYNHRLRIAFPCAANGQHLYEVPYAFLERKPYAPQIVLPHGDAEWTNASGDWPAGNWAGIQSEAFSLALFNRGTPSYCIDADAQGRENIYLSVLRSPCVPTCLHEPCSYTMQAFDGMRDAGSHHFEYALKSYAEGFAENSAVADGIGYNTLLPAVEEAMPAANLPEIRGDGVRIAAVKPAEEAEGIILRLVEYRGKAAACAVTVPAWAKAVYATDLKEDVLRQLPVEQGAVKLELHRFEIATLLFAF